MCVLEFQMYREKLKFTKMPNFRRIFYETPIREFFRGFQTNCTTRVDLELQMFMQPLICERAANLFRIGRKSLYLCECQYWDLFSNSIISTETVFNKLSIAVSVTCYIEFLIPPENSRCPLSCQSLKFGTANHLSISLL